MKIKYLGTAAAEGIPGMFCNCTVCQNARAVRGREIKTRSQALVDGKILIDFPPDTYMHVLYGGLDLTGIRTLIVTHSHSDHFFERDFWCRCVGIANNIPEEPLVVYATASSCAQAKAFMDVHMEGSERVLLHEITPFVKFESEGYTFIPLKANHDVRTDPVIFIIEKDGKSMLYANDTGIFPDESMDFLKNYDRRFDFVSLDCTGMLQKNWRGGHMSLDTNKEMYDALTDMGLCDAGTTVYVNHFSHNGAATHAELVRAASEYGFGVTYDGCEVEF